MEKYIRNLIYKSTRLYSFDFSVNKKWIGIYRRNAESEKYIYFLIASNKKKEVAVILRFSVASFLSE
jgi:hypothetical protein